MPQTESKELRWMLWFFTMGFIGIGAYASWIEHIAIKELLYSNAHLIEELQSTQRVLRARQAR